MKILIDLQAAQATNCHRGIGRYTMAITDELIKRSTHHDVEIMLSQAFPESITFLRDFFSAILPTSHIITWKGLTNVASLGNNPSWRRKTGSRIRESFITSRKPDFLYVPSVFEGLVDDALITVNAFEEPIPTAVTIYDLIPWLYQKPYLENPAMRAWYERQVNELKRANLWLAISESSRQDAIQQWSLPEEWVINTSCGTSNTFCKQKIIESEKQTFLKKHKMSSSFILYTAGIDYRKNIENLFKAYAKLPEALQHQYQLAVVCAADAEATTKLRRQITQFGIKDDRVVITGFVSDEDLIAFYNLCTVFVFPSLYEGFGLPILEAMACGAAVIGANRSSVPEVIGNEAALFDPTDVDSITKKLEEVLVNSDFRHELQVHATQQAQKFSWQRSAEKTLEALEKFHKENKAVTFESPHQSEYRNNHRLAYVSPLRPEKTGISNYSAELLFELTHHYDIDVIVNQKTVTDSWIHTNCQIRSLSWFKKHANEYQGRILYHIGNSEFHSHMFALLEKYPGIVVLHDFFVSGILSHLEFCREMPGIWSKALYYSHGYHVLSKRYKDDTDIETMIFTYPTNFAVLQQASGIITHSLFSYKLAQQWYGECVKKIPWSPIPHLRALPPTVTFQQRQKVRGELGFTPEDFVVCSFGVTGKLKLNDRLLHAWLTSSLAQDTHCHLFYVGENGGDIFGMALADEIAAAKTASSIKITGFASIERYQQYLIAADLVVQLRKNSLGETSGAVLDAMGNGLPVIINAHGTMADIPKACVHFISDCFSDVELQEALTHLREATSYRENLGKKARAYIETHHNPRKIAQHYAEHIEHVTQERHNQPQHHIRLMQFAVRVAHQEKYFPRKKELLEIAHVITENEPSLRQKQLLYDVSELVRRDAQSGIQRVVRGYLQELLQNPPKGYRIEPIYGHDATGTYYYARVFTTHVLNCPLSELPDEKADVYPGDIFLSIDLVTSGSEQRKKTYQEWKNKGVSLFFMVYDLLCVLYPTFFPDGAQKLFSRWLNMVTTSANGLVCISQTVANDLKEWIKNNGDQYAPPAIYWQHLGADRLKKIETECSDKFESEEDFPALLEKIVQRPTFLTVGTLEPRKGHQQALHAFELLWKKGIDVNWVIVGKVGWKTETLTQELQQHTERNKRLFWFEKASDVTLSALYQEAHACLVTSEAEGFGLPLIEAAQYKRPLLVRDIPVFREVAGSHASYFSGHSPQQLADALEQWLMDWQKGEVVSSNNMPYLTWQKSTEQLMNTLFAHQGRCG